MPAYIKKNNKTYDFSPYNTVASTPPCPSPSLYPTTPSPLRRLPPLQIPLLLLRIHMPNDIIR